MTLCVKKYASLRTLKTVSAEEGADATEKGFAPRIAEVVDLSNYPAHLMCLFYSSTHPLAIWLNLDWHRRPAWLSGGYERGLIA